MRYFVMSTQRREETKLSSVVNFFRNKQHWPLLLVLVVLLVWAQFGAPNLGQQSFNSIAEFKSPYLGALDFGKPGEPVAKRVVIVVVDGLRLDTSRQLPTFNRLRAQ